MSDKRLEITRDACLGLENALAKTEKMGCPENVHPLIFEAEKDGLRSEIKRLKALIKYEERRREMDGGVKFSLGKGKTAEEQKKEAKEDKNKPVKIFLHGREIKDIIMFDGPVTDPDRMIYIDEFGQQAYMKKEFYSDGTPQYVSTFIHDPRGETCCFCGRGWEDSIKSITDYYHLNTAPKGREHAHMECWLNYLRRTDASLFHEALAATRCLIWSGLEEIKNQYGGAWNTPWYKTSITGFVDRSHPDAKDYNKPTPRYAFDPKPELIMGARKRVYSLTLKFPQPVPFPKDEEAVKPLIEDDVTKSIDDNDYSPGEYGDEGSEFMIHAWNDDKVKEYIKAFACILIKSGIAKRTE